MEVPHRVGMLVYPDAQLLDIAGPLEVFARTARWLQARRCLAVPAYSVELVAASAGPVATSSGIAVVARHGFETEEAFDTLLVTGGIGYASACRDAALMAWVARHAARVPRLGSICTGALVLAAAGVLDGRAATTHWDYLDLLAAQAPGCRVDREAIYVRSGHVYTSAGVTAGIDLALGLVEQDWGRAVAVAVARELVVYRRRTAAQAQVSRFLEAERRGDRFGELQLWILDHLGGDLSVERLAQVVAMSVRNFSRQFRARMGETPAAFVLRLRVEEACRRLEEGGASLKDIARQCGFADEQALRRAFRRQLGVLPQAYRRHTTAA
ncbi:GlxA family transcriptional regulator [Luteimonas granuli]|uniref:GlxA family transcriptional regulator n=2 Tax=Luteimonas granuli TaxID=1176533 RepID=A0A518N7I9_9GAMM|nr:GlxA family transcriptional regulator [Luteimonas granuli]